MSGGFDPSGRHVRLHVKFDHLDMRTFAVNKELIEMDWLGVPVVGQELEHPASGETFFVKRVSRRVTALVQPSAGPAKAWNVHAVEADPAGME